MSRREGSLYGAHPGSVRVRDGVNLTAPVLGEGTIQWMCDYD